MLSRFSKAPFRTVLLMPFWFGLGAVAADLQTVSPKKTFRITQHREENWIQTFRPANLGIPEITLEKDVLWPAEYNISPDEQWILRVQKSGSGDNISYLYHVDKEGRLWRMETRFGDLAFEFLRRTKGVDISDLYHTGIEFEAWDTKEGLLRFTIHGTFEKQRGQGVREQMVYDLQNHQFRFP